MSRSIQCFVSNLDIAPVAEYVKFSKIKPPSEIIVLGWDVAPNQRKRSGSLIKRLRKLCHQFQTFLCFKTHENRLDSAGRIYSGLVVKGRRYFGTVGSWEEKGRCGRSVEAIQLLLKAYLASSARAKTPAASGAAADVPE